MNPGISVIIPSYNGIELLSEYMPDVTRSLEHIKPSEIIVVDDHSDDNTLEYLELHFPEVRVIRNPENLGFTRSINIGVSEAVHDLVLLLNNDIRPGKEYISSSLRYFDHRDTFGVMGIIKNEMSHTVMEGIKYPTIHVGGLKYKDIRNPEIERIKNSIYTFYLCGGNAIIDRKKLLALGGLLEIYHPFYQEDVDLSVRAWLSGWKLYFNNRAVCYHKHSATIKKYYKPEYIKQVSKRNRLILSYIYLKGFQWILFNLQTVIKSSFYRILHILGSSSVYPGYREFFRKKKELRNLRAGSVTGGDLKWLVSDIQKNIRENLTETGIKV